MQFTDTHSHLYDEAFASEEDLAVARAIEAGVSRIITPDIDSKTRKAMFDLAQRHPGTLFPTLGVHPTSVGADWKAEVESMFGHMDKKIVAIGEVGIDCYWSKEFIDEQKQVFRLMLDTAHEQNLPVIIHSRDSIGIIIDILKEYRSKNLRGVFHAYSGSIETYHEISRLGDWYVGIGGVLTFKKASIADTVQSIPLDRILLETDSPYLTPVPYRGKRNESSYIPIIAERLAALKGLDLSEVAQQTTVNTENLFGI